MSKALIIIGIAVVVAIGWLVISKTGQPQNPSPAITATQEKALTKSELEKAPDFHLQDYNGKTVSLADFSGKPLVINSWASWCPFCRQELSDFATAQKEFADKVTIIAIDRAESLAVAKGYTDQQGITNKLIFLLDPSDSFYR